MNIENVQFFVHHTVFFELECAGWSYEFSGTPAMDNYFFRAEFL